MNDPKAELKKVSQPLGLNPAVVDESTSIEARSLLLQAETLNAVLAQNVVREETNARLFQGLDDAKASADEAKTSAAQAVATATEAKAHGQAVLDKLNFQDERILGPIRADIAVIRKTTEETNGKVKVLRADVDPLMNERKKRLQDEEDNRLRREGLLVLPRTVGAALFWTWQHMIKPTMKAVSTFAVGLVVYEWIWNHRFFFGHQ
jgi:hypothetical protein